ncbi:MAG: thiamine-phosphate kinase [Bacteroidota bacterium]
MKLSAIGEFGFIRRVSPAFTQNLPKNIVGIGDDCAVIPWGSGTSLLVTTDMLVEGIHFLRDKISPRDLGYKTLAVNLSDIAAMGGSPTNAFISLGIPGEIEVEWLDDFYNGLHELAESENVSLLGGDTAKSPAHIVVTMTILGLEETRLIKYRSTARYGDYIYVTDCIGDSGGGLKILLEDIGMDEDTALLVRRHQRPKAHLMEGAWLAVQDGVHAMMDVSDGIDSDICRIMEASSCGAHIQIEWLPLSVQLRRVSKRYNWNAEEIALTGGEDYCLLITIDPEYYAQIAHSFQKKFNRPLTKIGNILEKEKGLQYSEDGKKYMVHKHGYDHFA